MPEFLFIGAHHDDLEIGAGATISKLVSSGQNIYLCVLTDESNVDIADSRRSETKIAAMELGIQPENLLFIGFEDGNLSANRESISVFRNTIKEHDLNPDIIVTHSLADSHNDHRAAAELVYATFREKVILGYGIINSLLSSEFNPTIFINTSEYWDKKTAALLAHKTQIDSGRILWDRIEENNRFYGEKITNSLYAEAFDIKVQAGGENKIHIAMGINDNQFNKFWYSLIKNRQVINIHSLPISRHRKEYNWKSGRDHDGFTLLRRSFTQSWYGKNPIEEINNENDNAEQIFNDYDCILCGGSVSNTLTRTFFNHFLGIRYIIDYDMPNYINIRIFDKKNNINIYPEYDYDFLKKRLVIVDKAILTIMINPMAEKERYIIGCMGIHGYGTLACYQALSDVKLIDNILNIIKIPFEDNVNGFQIIIMVNVKTNNIYFNKNSLHIF